MFSAALVAAGIGLVPGVAQADPVPGGGRAVSAPDSAAAADFAIALSSTGDTAHGITLTTALSSGAGAQHVSVDWGDGSTDVVQDVVGGELKSAHVYKKSGPYTVKVSAEDTAGSRAAAELKVVTRGSDFTPLAPTRLLDTRGGVGAPVAKVQAYKSAVLKIAGNSRFPAGVTAVALNVTVTNTTAGGHVTVSPGMNEPRPATSNLNYEAGQSVPNMVIVPVGADGTVQIHNGGWQAVDLIADVTGYFTRTSASGYTSLAPARFVDTRSGIGTAQGRLRGYGSIETRMAGREGIPAGATAVALNLTVTNPENFGHLTVYPSGGEAPTTSNLNFNPGQTVANSVIVPVGTDGKIKILNGGWTPADVIVDVVGYYSPAGEAAYMPVTPYRALDTRDPDSTIGKVTARDYLHLPFGGGASGVEAYVLNTTVTNTTGDGFLSVAPDPNSMGDYKRKTAVVPPRPVSSTLNWTTGRTVPNLVQASAGEHGVVDFWNQSFGDVDLIVDYFGYYESK
ncbi:PKD domain-containing protein [Streptomyces sp. NPDC058401]|uniref:PKD domain-containing protein n=1 Tax=Streptomyces sp. NPDC058401 TaxID=3346480 RepID=UPI00366707D3